MNLFLVLDFSGGGWGFFFLLCGDLIKKIRHNEFKLMFTTFNTWETVWKKFPSIINSKIYLLLYDFIAFQGGFPVKKKEGRGDVGGGRGERARWARKGEKEKQKKNKHPIWPINKIIRWRYFVIGFKLVHAQQYVNLRSNSTPATISVVVYTLKTAYNKCNWSYIENKNTENEANSIKKIVPFTVRLYFVLWTADGVVGWPDVALEWQN